MVIIPVVNIKCIRSTEPRPGTGENLNKSVRLPQLPCEGCIAKWDKYHLPDLAFYIIKVP